jgi:hypothetical protein
MIQIVTGKLGAGKTMHTVRMMFEKLCRGSTVVTNIDVNWSAMKELAASYAGVHLDDAQLVKLDPAADKNWQRSIPFGTRKLPVQVYLDEIHLFYNSRDWAQTEKFQRQLLSFLTQSRKACVDVTFIAQDAETIEKQFRAQAEWELAVVSALHIPLGALIKIFHWFFPCYIVRKRSVSAQEKSKVLIGKQWCLYHPRWWSLYHSFQFLDGEMRELAESARIAEPFKLRRVTTRERLSHGVRVWIRETWGVRHVVDFLKQNHHGKTAVRNSDNRGALVSGQRERAEVAGFGELEFDSDPEASRSVCRES